MYFVNKLFEDNISYYVKLDSKNNSYIDFSYFENTLKLDINLFLKGNYNLPHNHFYLNIISNLGNIDLLSLNLIETNNYIYHYNVICNINLNETIYKDKDIFLQSLFFDCYLNIDYEIIQDLDIDLQEFIEDVNKISYKGNIEFSNYFPIVKLSEYYINSKYKSNYRFLNNIPNDFFTWNNNNQIVYPTLWFNRYIENYNDDFQVINPIYYSNLGNGKISDYVTDLNLEIDYYINNNDKKTLKINNNYLNNNYMGNGLFLGISTIYDFEQNEIRQVYSDGINGIYFPIKSNGEINISFKYKNIKYSDSIPFSYNINFFSNSNSKLSFKIEALNNTDGYWNKIGA